MAVAELFPPNIMPFCETCFLPIASKTDTEPEFPADTLLFCVAYMSRTSSSMVSCEEEASLKQPTALEQKPSSSVEEVRFLPVDHLILKHGNQTV